MGKDLLYLVSSSGNYKGAKWLQSVLGEQYRVHVTEEIYRSSHIDSTVLALRPGLVMLNSTRVSEKNCPEIFKNWDKFWFDDVAPTTESELKFQKEVRDPIASKLEAATLTFPLRPSFGHSVLLPFGAFDLDGSCILGVGRIPILSGFVAPTEKLSNVSKCSFRGHLYLSATGARVSLSGCRRKPHAGRPRHNIAIIRSSFHGG